jgi:hypothetical protein
VSIDVPIVDATEVGGPTVGDDVHPGSAENGKAVVGEGEGEVIYDQESGVDVLADVLVGVPIAFTGDSDEEDDGVSVDVVRNGIESNFVGSALIREKVL